MCNGHCGFSQLSDIVLQLNYQFLYGSLDKRPPSELHCR